MTLARWIGTPYWDELANTPSERVLIAWRAHARPDEEERAAIREHVERRYEAYLADLDRRTRDHGRRLREAFPAPPRVSPQPTDGADHEHRVTERSARKFNGGNPVILCGVGDCRTIVRYAEPDEPPVRDEPPAWSPERLASATATLRRLRDEVIRDMSTPARQTPAPADEAEPALVPGARYRDADGDVWTVETDERLRYDDNVTTWSVVARAYGPLEPLQDDPGPHSFGARLRDRDGDVWTVETDGRLRYGEMLRDRDDVERSFGPLRDVQDEPDEYTRGLAATVDRLTDRVTDLENRLATLVELNRLETA